MNWTRMGSWFEQSGCGRYSVCASKVEGKFMFQAWHGSKPGELLLTDTDAQKCREACAEHAVRAGRDPAPEGEGK